MEMAKAAAEFAAQCLHHIHKGVIDCGNNKIVVFFNGEWPDLPDKVTHFLRESGISDAFEISKDTSEASLALVATNLRESPVDLDFLNRILWEQEESFYREAQMVPVMSFRQHKIIAVQTGKRTAVLAKQWDSDSDTYTVFTEPLPLKAVAQALKYYHCLPYAELVKWLRSVGSNLCERLPH